jgi:2-polyprenyl-3-methyl-5-hydroxy-6-metoxy-1,4-benzoquinol methylase
MAIALADVHKIQDELKPLETPGADVDALRDSLFEYYDRSGQTDYWAYNSEKIWRKFLASVKSELELAMIVSYQMNLRGANVLVIGSHLGGEAVAYALCGAKVVGVDLNKDAINVARQLASFYQVDITFLHKDGAYTGYPDEYFDYVSCAQVLEHVSQKHQIGLLSEIWRVCRKGGLFWIDTPNQCNPKDSHDTGLYFIHWLPRALKIYLARLLGRQVPYAEPGFGFEVVHLHYYLSFFFLNRVLRAFGNFENLSVYRGFPSLTAYTNARRRQGRGDGILFATKLVLLKTLFSFWTHSWFAGIRVLFRKVN